MVQASHMRAIQQQFLHLKQEVLPLRAVSAPCRAKVTCSILLDRQGHPWLSCLE